ncbi:hypothetical protein [Parasphingorhabdus sp.]|uniref:YobI family P-loop NTPase n=1 Tax=Parasphingorhabdus sp. TaxID=2709688 RepID=UPI003D2912B8
MKSQNSDSPDSSKETVRKQIVTDVPEFEKTDEPPTNEPEDFVDDNAGELASDRTAFIDLAPINNADLDRGYNDAMQFALSNDRISNIALSGPYGSGKSSIITTFEKLNPKYEFLKISLASFSESDEGTKNGDDDANKRNGETDDSKIKTVDIERSILQQMLYGASANELPYSRFKRIATPQHSVSKSVAFVFWLLAGLYVFNNWGSFINFNASHAFDGVKAVIWICVIGGLVYLFTQIYKSFFGHSLKKISLKNAEIEMQELSARSVLNHHLDEIIYFFQETNYDVVVIEDLDRFENPEIFVKLREINRLINGHKGNSKPTKFLYALRDDMFINRNRAKFFDFIIPVIPIINASNSLDKMQERLSTHDFSDAVDQEFLREVSLYLDDLRLIQNIFNELVVYHERLKSDKLDVTKLLAMIIYKNQYPSDFENLHHGKGAFFSICAQRTEYLSILKTKLQVTIKSLHEEIASSDAEEVGSIDDLMRIYLAQIMTHVPAGIGVFRLVTDEGEFSFSDILDYKKFSSLIGADDISVSTHAQVHPNYRRSLGISFGKIESELNSDKTFEERVTNIRNRTVERKSAINEKIEQLEREISRANRLKFSKILESIEIDYSKILKTHDVTDGRLLVYLVKNGHLDDNYYQYTSSFHEGRLSQTDRDFLLNIRSFGEPEPLQPIDNPEEVCRNMRQDDFRSRNAFNVELLDYLIENPHDRSAEVASIVKYISENFEQSETFLKSYYKQGRKVDGLLKTLTKDWPTFLEAISNTEVDSDHLRNVLSHADDMITTQLRSEEQVCEYISENAELLFLDNPPSTKEAELLQKLEVKFANLQMLESIETLQQISMQHDLYRLNTANVLYILTDGLEEGNKALQQANTANYSRILASDSASLKGYVEKNIATYVSDVFLRLEENTREDEAAIISLLNNSEIGIEEKKLIILKQDHIFNSLENLPTSLWSDTLSEQKIRLSWSDVSMYLAKFEDEKSTLVDAMQAQGNLECLSNEKIVIDKLGEKEASKLSDFVYDNDSFGDTEYCSFMKCMPYRYNRFPTDVSDGKISCIADLALLNLNRETFDFCSDKDDLKTKLIASNFGIYIDKKDEYEVSNEIRKSLLTNELENNQKIQIAQELMLEEDADETELLQQLASLFNSVGTDISKFNNNAVLRATITNPVNSGSAIELLTKSMSKWTELEVMDILKKFPYPYYQIATYGKRPSLKGSDRNLKLATALKAKNFISSYSVGWTGKIRVNTKLKRPVV